MLTEYQQKVKGWIKENKRDLYAVFIIFLVGLGSFGLGRLSAVWRAKEPLKVNAIANPAQNPPINKKGPQTSAVLTPITTAKGQFVASKSGTSYHYPWCPGALKIKEENKVWFNTQEEAKSGGYKPAGNCPGL